MNFEIDTKQKTITLLDDCTLKEIFDLKQWLGEDWESYKLTQRTVTLQQDRWIPYTPSYPLQPSYVQPQYPFQVWCTNDSVADQKYKVTCSVASSLPPVTTFN